MSLESVKKWVQFTDAGASKSGLTRIWYVTGKNGPEDGIGTIRWHGAWQKYVYDSDLAFYDADCLRLIANFCEEQTAAHIERNRRRKAVDSAMASTLMDKPGHEFSDDFKAMTEEFVEGNMSASEMRRRVILKYDRNNP